MPGAHGFVPTCGSASTGLPPTGRRPSGESSAAVRSILVPLDFESAEGELARYEPAVPADVDDLFYREWVRVLLARAVADLQASAVEAGRPEMFEVFRRYDLIDDEQARPTYAELARSLGITATAVTNHLAAMRKRFRQLVLDRLRDLTSSDEEWEAEATRLLGRR